MRINLLEVPEIEGYPTDYLIARIKGKRASLILLMDKPTIVTSPLEYLQGTRYRGFIKEYSKDGVWYLLWSEYRWIYRQMNRGLREEFYYLFVYLELKRLIMCLRYRSQEGGEERVRSLLLFSLLLREIKKALIEEDLPDIITALEYRGITGLKEAFSERGLPGVEGRLMDWFFDRVSSIKIHPLIRWFFTYVIDSINIVTLFKYLTWHIDDLPLFIRHGSLTEERLSRIWNQKKIETIILLLQGLTGILLDKVTGSNIGAVIKDGLIRKTAKIRREGSDEGLLLDYIIRLSHEVEEIGLFIYGNEGGI